MEPVGGPDASRPKRIFELQASNVKPFPRPSSESPDEIESNSFHSRRGRARSPNHSPAHDLTPLAQSFNVEPFPRPLSESPEEIESIDYNSIVKKYSSNNKAFPRPPSETPESAKPETYVPPPHFANYLKVDVALRMLLLATTLVSVIVICSVYHKYSRHFGTSIALSLVAAIQLILLAWLSVYTLSKRIPKQAN